MNDNPARLHAALRAHAKGLYASEAAAELLIAQATWLRRRDFLDGFVRIATSTTGNTEVAEVDWPGAITALAAGDLPCSGGEGRMLRLVASLAVGIPVSLCDTLTAIDGENTKLIARAVLHASGRRPESPAPWTTLRPATHFGTPTFPWEQPMNNPAGRNETTDVGVTLPAPGADNIIGVLDLAAGVLAHLARDPRAETNASAFLAEILGTPAQLEDLIDVCRNQAALLHACPATDDYDHIAAAGTAG